MADKLQTQIILMAQRARLASRQLALVSTDKKNEALYKMADALRQRAGYIIEENKKDLKAAQKKNYAQALVERLALNEKRIHAMAQSLFDTAQLKDPVGQVLNTFIRPNGLIIEKVRVPIGVIGIIYESRPNVTSDCIGLCLKSGNSVILKGGREALYSNRAILKVLKDVLKGSSIPIDCVQLVDITDRRAVIIFLAQDKYVDVIVPRGGESLIEFVAKHSRIPVVKHYKGVCHTFVSDKADLKMAQSICYNAKVQRPGVCNAMETMLVHRNVAEKFLPVMLREFHNAGVEIRGDERTRKLFKGVKKATENDWETEYLDLILSVRVVDDLKQAIQHINNYGSHHSDAIVTEDHREAEEFLNAVDSACVYENVSTRFTDGYEFGFGAEVGISTDKLHARGPMALEELTTYKYVVHGKGQIRK